MRKKRTGIVVRVILANIMILQALNSKKNYTCVANKDSTCYNDGMKCFENSNCCEGYTCEYPCDPNEYGCYAIQKSWEHYGYKKLVKKFCVKESI